MNDTKGKPENEHIPPKPRINKTEDNTIREIKKEERKLSFQEDLKQRLAQVKTTRWIRFIIVTVLFFLFVLWIGNPWLIIIWLLLIDIYLTAYIPWTWWKKKKGPVRAVMAWVDAIIYALVLVYIIFAFIGQNYKIPSSSLEKSLLVGDYLWVNKMVYGPRVPNTPLHFPLAQHTMPFIGGKSYIDQPQLSYHRLPGLRSIQRGDIVVFNFPEGDTVLSKMPEDDYYLILNQLKQIGVKNPREHILQNQEKYGEIIVRPVDRRENYVKRAIGLPGEKLSIINDTVYINGKPIGFADNVQFNYIVRAKSVIPEEDWQSIGVRREDRTPYTSPDSSAPYFYSVPLTAEMKKVVMGWPQVVGPLEKENEMDVVMGPQSVWPLNANWNWTRSNTNEFWIPKRGSTLHLTLNNLPLYERAITAYEGNKLDVRNGKIYINDKPSDYYTFKYDYYWMMGDNRDRSLDSRYFGLVPEDHIVGTPMRILISFDDEKGLISGIRWNRIFANPNPDKSKSAEKNW